MADVDVRYGNFITDSNGFDCDYRCEIAVEYHNRIRDTIEEIMNELSLEY